MKFDISRHVPASFYIILIFLLFSLFLNGVFASDTQNNIMINEVMYNPEEDNNYNEWIELYNPTSLPINVSGWTLYDGQQEDSIEANIDYTNATTIIPPGGYAIVTDHGTMVYESFTVSESAIKLYVDDSAICGYGLNNEKEKLLLNDTSGTIIDAVEWGEDYTDIPGAPANNVQENSSLARYENTDTNDTNNDFFESTNPTPGSRNQYATESKLEIETYPRYIPKIENNSEYSLPFAIKINISNFPSNETYQLKAYLTRNLSGRWPASQTWDENTWTYSDRYTHTIYTDENGNWTDWIYLRFKKNYVEYQNNIKRNDVAYINVKLKKEDNSTNEISKQITLLDMDETTSNGTTGGYIIGTAKSNNTFLENKIIIIENKSNVITGIYLTENNEIDDDLISTHGYYKITSPVGSENTIKFLDEEGKEIHVITNVTAEQGKYGVDVSSSESFYFVKLRETLDIHLEIGNIGDFNDNITISVDQISNGWQATLNQEKISLNPESTKEVNLHIIPYVSYECRTSSVTISVTSEKDPGESEEITIDFEILGPDLTIKNIKNYDEYGEQNNIFGEGEIVEIKAFLKNLGNENATDVNVMFYYDSKDEQHFIGSKQYDSVSKYQKYPSVEWDTKDVTPGNHAIIVIADEGKQIDELDETNNELSTDVMIHNTSPTKNGKDVLITEVYYHTHARINNEFITIYNPTNYSINISGWYLTNKPLKTRADQTKIVFPENTTIPPEAYLYTTQNASAFTWETGKTADFEYTVDSDDNVAQMFAPKQFTLSNNGGIVVLKDWYNHTIDAIIYGERKCNISEWNGTPVPDSGSAVILKRNFDKSGLPIDTNTSSDWMHPRRYGIGQSDFPYTIIPFTGEIQTFVSPDSSFETIVSELRKANESIYFNIYEFTNPFLCDELVAALRRNVSVNIFLEGSPVGGIPDKEKFILNRIAAYGGNIRLIVNDKENDVYARYTFDHGKYLVIDNSIVIVESCNWAKTGIPKDPTYGNREWGVVVRSKDVAKYFLDVFLDDWGTKRCDSYSFDKMDFSVPYDFFMDETIPYGWYEPRFESVIYEGNFSATPVFSPDTSYWAICDMIDSAEECIYIEQLYIYKDWKDQINPFVEKLVNKAKQGINVKIIFNYNPRYESTNEKCNITKQYFEENGIEVKFIYTNWSYFTNVHNKGMIVDNRSVLIASINWNENSVTRNREAGIIIENEEVARYYTEVFFYDWNLSAHERQNSEISSSIEQNKNTIYIGVIFTITFAVIARDWRKRKWT